MITDEYVFIRIDPRKRINLEEDIRYLYSSGLGRLYESLKARDIDPDPDYFQLVRTANPYWYKETCITAAKSLKLAHILYWYAQLGKNSYKRI